jgi:hypothetical protein
MIMDLTNDTSDARITILANDVGSAHTSSSQTEDHPRKPRTILASRGRRGEATIRANIARHEPYMIISENYW